MISLVLELQNYLSRNPNNLNPFWPNQVTFGSNSLRAMGPKIWNCLPNELKPAENLNSVKNMIKHWDGLTYKCNACHLKYHVNLAHFCLEYFIYQLISSFLYLSFVYSI